MVTTSTSEPPPPSAGLIVPIVIWGSKPPKHNVVCVKFLNDCCTVLTGSDNGHIITWRLSEDAITPLLLLIGHENAITAFSSTTPSPQSQCFTFISASEDGNICLWDIQDGRCVDNVSTIYVHRDMRPYTYKSSRHTRTTRLFCIGDYADFVVMDPQDLTIVYNLSSRVEPDWISAYAIIQRSSKADICIGLSAAGMMKIWSLIDLEKKDMANPLYEDESRRLDLRSVKDVSFNSVNERLFLILSASGWMLVDVEDLSVIISHEGPVGVLYGQIIDIDKVVIGYEDQSLRIFQLPLRQLPGVQVQQRFGSNPRNYMDNEKAFEVAILESHFSRSINWCNDVHFAFARQIADSTLFQVARADRDGRILIWRIPRFDGEFFQKLTSPSQLPLKYKGTFEESLDSVWQFVREFEKTENALLDLPNITSSLLISPQGKLLLGRSDGLLLQTCACDAVSRQLLDITTPQEKSAIRRLVGHTAAVTCLFYPHEHHSRYDQQILLSGSKDFSVIVWNLASCSKLFRFSVHGGPIQRFLVPPSNCSKQISKCVCVISGDHSVSLLNIRDMKCCLLASRHPHAVREVRWRPLDDFMLVRLDDGSVYVWQMETANIDRIVTGLMAEDVMNACDEQVGKEGGTDEAAASSAIQLIRALKNKNIDAMKQVAGQSDQGGCCEEDIVGSIDVGSPLSICPLPNCDTGAHLVQFEIGAIICGLISVDSFDTSGNEENSSSGMAKQKANQFETELFMNISKLLLSLLHAWTVDQDLDDLCIKKLGMDRPKNQLYYGNVSRHGQLSVVLPQRKHRSFYSFSQDVRWQASHSLTTTHLLAVISISNTLMAMKNLCHGSASKSRGGKESAIEKQQIRQAMSLVAALHCVLLPDNVKPKSSYAAPRIELLARRWQDACVEIRTAAQALLVHELKRLNVVGRRRLIESWAPFLPPLLDPSLSIFGARLQSSVPTLPPSAPPIPPRQKHSPPPVSPVPVPETGSEDGENGVQQVRRNQATAIILLGVVGAEFGDELNRADLTRATALSLLELLVAAPSPLLPVHSPLRRAAIDLLGKGFIHWEPHLEISKVLLGLLDLAANSDRQPQPLIPGAPLSPIADACRTARHALSLIAIARPPALLTALSMEVARYNSAAQHQTIQHTVLSPLLKSRSEVLRIIEELADKKYSEVAERMLSVGEVLVHCLDTSLLKQKSLGEVFPPITKFNMVSYCPSSRRIAFGGFNGNCVVHELRAAKAHTLQSHSGPILAISFSEEGKYLATYGVDSKINIWQTSQSFLGMGQTQMKLLKTQPAPSCPSVSANGQPYHPRIVWINSKSLTLMLPEGREQRFTI